jgi:hypothetical protein
MTGYSNQAAAAILLWLGALGAIIRQLVQT